MARSLGLGLACFAVLVAAASATQFRVGGQKGWSVPDAGFEPYNTWAGKLRFQKGDQLLFVYPKDTDSVLLVDPAAYNACNVSSYTQKFDDGNTVVTLDRSGPFFFISGNEANCRANEKLIVVVLADRTPPGALPPTTAPPSPSPVPPSPSSSTPPAAAPALSPSATPPSGGGATPLPAPAATPTASPPSPAASAPAPGPTATPTTSPPAPMAPSPSFTTPGGGASQPPSASANAPGAEGNPTTPPPPSASDRSAAAGFVVSLGAFIGYAMLAA
ncbi:unnamed protein product [Urochloa humidicola]